MLLKMLATLLNLPVTILELPLRLMIGKPPQMEHRADIASLELHIAVDRLLHANDTRVNAQICSCLYAIEHASKDTARDHTEQEKA